MNYTAPRCCEKLQFSVQRYEATPDLAIPKNKDFSASSHEPLRTSAVKTANRQSHKEMTHFYAKSGIFMQIFTFYAKNMHVCVVQIKGKRYFCPQFFWKKHKDYPPLK
ncbi:MAG: hypothetical protein II200_04120 [Bacteroidaceae bacterium]|nr:hypothetical protein [Bacteroidaceae bacterium]